MVGSGKGKEPLIRDWRTPRNILIQGALLWVMNCAFSTLTINVYAEQKNVPAVKGEGETEDNMRRSQAWQPPPPAFDEFDWIQLTSGEWLKGELKKVYEDKIEFDSDKLELQEFDLKDVKEVRSPRILGVGFEGPVTVYGTLHMTEDRVFVTVGKETREFNRSELISIASYGEREIMRWSAKVDIGANVSRGNSEQTQYSAQASIRRLTTATRFAVDYLGNFSQAEGIETINNQRVTSYLDIFRTRKYFFRPFSSEYYRDPHNNIDRSLTVGAGIGYHLIRTYRTEWDIYAGPAYQETRFISVEAGEDSRESTPAFLAGTHFNTELTKTVDLDFSYDLKLLNEASGRYTHHVIAALETELTKWLSFDISVVWDRTQNPTPKDDGKLPKKDDFYFIFSLGIDF
jgi:putative salt-induced outer membrane protein YdiY